MKNPFPGRRQTRKVIVQGTSHRIVRVDGVDLLQRPVGNAYVTEGVATRDQVKILRKLGRLLPLVLLCLSLISCETPPADEPEASRYGGGTQQVEQLEDMDTVPSITNDWKHPAKMIYSIPETEAYALCTKKADSTVGEHAFVKIKVTTEPTEILSKAFSEWFLFMGHIALGFVLFCLLGFVICHYLDRKKHPKPPST